MTGVVCDHYNSCLITPQQTLPNNFHTTGNDGFMNCVSYVPSQQGGFIVGNNYNFSEGFSIDPCCNLNTNPFKKDNLNFGNNDFNYNGNYDFSNDYSFAEGLDVNPNMFNQTNPNFEKPEKVHFENDLMENDATPRQFVNVNASNVPPEGFNEEGKLTSLSPSFFASNSAFKRIPLNSGRSIFRRRKPGDCHSEWSNAFDKDCEEGLYDFNGQPDNQF